MKINAIGSNQTEVQIENGRVLFSYNTAVAACVGGTYYRTEQHHSKTTSKHINAWLDGAKAEQKPQPWFDALT